MSKALVAQDALLKSVVPDLKALSITSPISLGIGKGVMDDIFAAQALSAQITQMLAPINAIPSFVADAVRGATVFEALGGIANIQPSSWIIDATRVNLNIFGALDLPKFPLFETNFTFPIFDSILENIQGLLPTNWPKDLHFNRAQKIQMREGIPLVWVPRRRIVRELVQASSPKARSKIIVKRSGKLLADIEKSLTVVDDYEPMAYQVGVVRQAVDAYRRDHFEVAQMASTCILDALVMDQLSYSHSAVPREIEKLNKEAAMVDFVLASSLAPLVRVYSPYFPLRGDPIPKRFNRHATVHSGDKRQFNQRNALVAMMLVVSFMRTVQHYAAVEEAEAA
jgi:hypothetical protein